MPFPRPATFSERPRTRTVGAGRPRTAVSVAGGPEYSPVVCAVMESRGLVAQVGLAFVDPSTSECTLCEFSDSQSYVNTVHNLGFRGICEIIVPDNLEQNPTSKLLYAIHDMLPNMRVTSVPRKHFNDKAGAEHIMRLSFQSEAEALNIALSGKFCAMAAAAAAIVHAELQFNVKFLTNGLRVKYQSSDGMMIIDYSTVRNLELIQNLRNPKSGDCLYGLLNRTVTPMGARLLRSSILQPLTDQAVLEDRLDAVQEMVSSQEMFHATKKALQAFSDMDKLLTSLIIVPTNQSSKFFERSINDVILLKKELGSIAPVYIALGGCQSKLLCTSRNLFMVDKVQAVQELIDRVISPDTTWANTPLDLRNQRCYAVNSGMNGLLDVARLAYKEQVEVVFTMSQELCREYELPSLELKYEVQRGYYLRIPTADIEEKPLPPVFVNILRKKKFTECTTLEIMKRNARLGDIVAEVLLMSDKSIKELIDAIRADISDLYKVSEGIGMLDMICSFAALALSQEYCRPEFKGAVAIKSGRHPIREKIHKEKFIPNDTYAGRQSRFQIVTGCNMSGKSTFIRQLALLTVMAQIGSFVPAEYAAFPIVGNLFARVSMDDGVEANVSTFAAEMRETAFILQNATADSMIIIDELGRGTCTQDGLAIAIAVCEALIARKAYVWFATHFRELGAVLAHKSGAITLHMEVEMREEQNMTSMLYKIADGPAAEQHYGINLARIVGLPLSIIQRASEVSTVIAQKAEQRKVSSKGYIEAQRQKTVFQLIEHLHQARNSSMTDQALRRWLTRLQQDFSERMDALKRLAAENADGEDDEDETDETIATTSTTEITTADEGGDTSADVEMSMSGQEASSMLLSPTGSPEQATASASEESHTWHSQSHITDSGGGSNSYYSGELSTTEEGSSTRNDYPTTSDTYASSLDLQDIEELSDVEDQI
ncbi:MutS protein msh4 [Orbilia brochopaga]|uniref:DNA mismatch repair protein MSH3 n=1 Tax=Orbilia brochopaga TaxID=3140254 RepID=A0AAV9UN79_9PEZI